jgi:hypothetical protein
MLLGATSQAQASTLTLIYNDTFTSQDSIYPATGTPSNFTGNTPFQVVAVFDPNAPVFNMFPGFNAYAPISAVLTVAGQSYTINDADVSIFDPTNFFSPGRYAVGFIQNPAQDQEGFVADYSGASPNFSVNNLVPTTFTGYNGTGFQPGSGIPPGCDATDSCTGHNNTPIHLTSGGVQYLLTTADRDSGPFPAGSASLVTPEPSSIWIVCGGLLALGLLRVNLRLRAGSSKMGEL